MKPNNKIKQYRVKQTVMMLEGYTEKTIASYLSNERAKKLCDKLNDKIEASKKDIDPNHIVSYLVLPMSLN